MIYEYCNLENRALVDQYVIDHIGGYINGRIGTLSNLEAGDEVVIYSPSTISSDATKVIEVMYELVHRGVRVSFVEPECSFSAHALCDTDSLLGAVNCIDQYLVNCRGAA